MLPFDLGVSAQALATADPPTHAVHRNAVFPELVARRMATLRPDVEALAAERLGGLRNGERMEFVERVANAIPIRIVSKLIGFCNEDAYELLATGFDSTAMLAATESVTRSPD